MRIKRLLWRVSAKKKAESLGDHSVGQAKRRPTIEWRPTHPTTRNGLNNAQLRSYALSGLTDGDNSFGRRAALRLPYAMIPKAFSLLHPVRNSRMQFWQPQITVFSLHPVRDAISVEKNITPHNTACRRYATKMQSLNIYSMKTIKSTIIQSIASLRGNLLPKQSILSCVITIIFLCASFILNAQEKKILTFDEYINNVKNSNIEYLIEKYNVDIADANVKAAKVFPDPELSVSYANNENWKMQMGYGIDAELAYTLELGGKRKARIRLAQSEKEMTESLLEDYFRNLRAEATIAYLTALKQKEIYQTGQSSYLRMFDLAKADSIRFSFGSIPEVDARQSRLEAASLLNEVYSSENELQEILAQLLLYQGSKTSNIPDSIAGELRYTKRDFLLQDLIVSAQNNRADLQAALKQKEVSQNNLRLAKANRAIDLGLSIGGGYSSIVRNEIAPAPEFKSISAGISIPLKFSNTNKGELRAAQLAVKQSELEYEAIEMQIASEVILAHNKYLTTCRQVEQFNTGLLEDAKIILDKRTYSYERGETSILEVLNAQRTYNDIQISYIETLYDCAVALIDLERISGI
ncbi:TolC family protein [Bacteroidales bacterium OttesenSCG-928-A17]|nr:TolC family protein [Bacteroidales bacterium OttesenSCG-928-A17]